MAKIMISIFMGVFVSALLYEVIRRQDPELVDALMNKLRNSLTS